MISIIFHCSTASPSFTSLKSLVVEESVTFELFCSVFLHSWIGSEWAVWMPQTTCTLHPQPCSHEFPSNRPVQNLHQNDFGCYVAGQIYMLQYGHILRLEQLWEWTRESWPWNNMRSPPLFVLTFETGASSTSKVTLESVGRDKSRRWSQRSLRFKKAASRTNARSTETHVSSLKRTVNASQTRTYSSPLESTDAE